MIEQLKSVCFFSLTTAAIILYTQTAHARRSSQESLYLGGGLYREIHTYKTDTVESHFGGWGASAIAGIQLSVSNNFDIFFEGEFGRHELLNTIKSEGFLEKSINDVIVGKVGLTYNVLSLGVGLQKNNLNIVSVSSLNTEKSHYEGLTYLAIGRLTVPTESHIQPVIELKAGMGQISGIQYTELQAGLFLRFLPF